MPIFRRKTFGWSHGPRCTSVGILLALLAFPPGVWARCALNVADGSGVAPVPMIVRVSGDGLPAVPAGHLRVTFLGHSSFLVTTPGGASIVTDYNDGFLPASPPHAATMSNSHHLHSSETIDPALTLPLRGWDPEGGIARVEVMIRDAKVFNIPTNFSEAGGIRVNGNSIFIVEAAGLCVAHLGNLRHLLDRKSLRDLGRIDVLFISADGSWTLSHTDAVQLIRQISPSIVIPMQYGFMGPHSFAVAAMRYFPVKELNRSSLLISRSTLPRGTEVFFVRPLQEG